jgi:hypothetical protein
MHSLLYLAASQPQLLMDHAEAYTDLLVEEAAAASIIWKRRALLTGVAICCLGVAAVLAGVALMLWAVIPAASIQAPWALIGAPLLPTIAAVGCMVTTGSKDGEGAFINLRRHIKADMTILRGATAS